MIETGSHSEVSRIKILVAADAVVDVLYLLDLTGAEIDDIFREAKASLMKKNRSVMRK